MLKSVKLAKQGRTLECSNQSTLKFLHKIPPKRCPEESQPLTGLLTIIQDKAV